MPILYIIKRNGETESYKLSKVTNAIYAAMKAEKKGTKKDAERIELQVEKILERLSKKLSKKDDPFTPNVEEIQDIVEECLMISDFHPVAKAYILYREKKRLERKRDIF